MSFTDSDVTELAARLGMDLLDQKAAGDGVLYVIPWGPGFDEHGALLQAALGVLDEEGRELRITAVDAEHGRGFVIRDVTPESSVGRRSRS
ncbi:MAG TPA: hypothetical protein VNS09_02330 [Solirubrobacter sp.]|nr:hypothetical protein [Solirubrobacter sp.]